MLPFSVCHVVSCVDFRREQWRSFVKRCELEQDASEDLCSYRIGSIEEEILDNYEDWFLFGDECNDV